MHLHDIAPTRAFALGHAVPLSAIAGGVLCYAASLLGWLAALRHLPLNVAYPMLSISYALVYLLAVCIPSFGETLTPGKTLGVLCILLGAILIGAKPPPALR